MYDSENPITPSRHLTITAFHGLDRAAGVAGNLPWPMTGHLARTAARMTEAPCVAVGHRTALRWHDALRRLPGRVYVLSRSTNGVNGFATVPSIRRLAEIESDDILVVGGAAAFAETLPHATFMELTIADAVAPDATTRFPAWNPADWQVLLRTRHDAGDEGPHSSTTFLLARRIGADDTDDLRAALNTSSADVMPLGGDGH
jgi:dihydrofolate reductase